MQTSEKLSLIAIACIFLVAIGSQTIIPALVPSRRAVTIPVAQSLPTTLPPWQVTDMPIAESEFLSARVSDILQFDEAIMRSYRMGDTEVLIYVAYWKPEKAPYSAVGVHTPDTCWVHNGWRREATASSQTFSWDEHALQPAETGTFSFSGKLVYVAFWHLVGGCPISYGQYGWDESWRGKVGRAILHLQDWHRFGFAQRDDQCFIRISSNRPLFELMSNPDVQVLLEHLRPLGLFLRHPAAGNAE